MPDPKDRHAPQMVTLPAPPESLDQVADAATVYNSSQHPLPVPSSSGLDVYIGRTLENRYVVETLLGEGGMGFVYRGRHKLIDKRVAIKILRSDFVADTEMTERFLNEAKAASSIGNPHIVDISDFGRLPDGAAFFVMEFLDGVSLAQLMNDLRVVPVPRLIHIAKQIARGLAAAHGRGIVHRDLKPDNVMLIQRGEDRDFVKILDFGIAKVGGEAGRLTRAGSVFGTPHYMSPEQAAGVPVNERTDIYSLGVILYEMASGKVPFDADNFMGILTQHMYKAPAPIRAIVPQPQEVPPGLEAVVLKCLSKKVELRYQTMDELVADLERVEKGMVPEAVPEMMARSGGFNVPADYFRNPQRVLQGAGMMPATPLSRPRRNTLLYGVAVGTCFVLGSVGIALGVLGSRQNASADTTPSSMTAAPPPSTMESAPAVAPLPAPAPIGVSIVTEPTDANAYVTILSDPSDTPARAPREVGIPAGGTLAIKVEAKGYKTSGSITLKASDYENRARVHIVKLVHDGPAGKVTPTPVVRPPITKPATTPAPSPSPTPSPSPSAKPAPPPPCPPGQTRMFGKCETI